MQRGAVLVAMLLAAAAARGQPSPTWRAIPPGSSEYFGSPIDDAFTPNTLAPLLKGDLPKPAAPSEPLPRPARLPPALPSTELPPPTPDVPLPSLAGDGLFPPDAPLVPALPPEPTFPPPRNVWAGSGDIGLNGASGNTNLFNFRTTWHVTRRTPRNLFVNDFQYGYLHQDSKTEQQQAFLNSRDELLFPGRPWSAFSALQVEYDELRAYRFRVGEYIGAGYKVIDDRSHLLRLRLGAGATRELGIDGARNQWVPEAVLGHDMRYRFDDRNSFASVVDFYPRIDRQAGQYRVRARVAYESILDPKTGTIVRFGVQDRYDSNPGNALRNDLTYFATFGLKF
jgi:hypothetical protein